MLYQKKMNEKEKERTECNVLKIIVHFFYFGQRKIILQCALNAHKW